MTGGRMCFELILLKDGWASRVIWFDISPGLSQTELCAFEVLGLKKCIPGRKNGTKFEKSKEYLDII